MPVEPQLGSRNVNAGSVPPDAAAWKSENLPMVPFVAVATSVNVDFVSGSAL